MFDRIKQNSFESINFKIYLISFLEIAQDPFATDVEANRRRLTKNGKFFLSHAASLTERSYSSRSHSRSQRRYSKSPRNNRNRSPRSYRQKETRPSPRRSERSDRNDKNDKNSRPFDKPREPEPPRPTEKSREKAKVVPDEKEAPKKLDDKTSKKSASDKQEKPKQRTSNGADYEKKREYQVKITEQKISFKETVRGKQPEPRETKISISSASSPSRTPSPFLKPHERKDFVSASKPPADGPPKPIHKVITKEFVQLNSDDDSKGAKTKRMRSSSASSADVEVVNVSKKVELLKKGFRKSDKLDGSSKKKEATGVESRKRSAHDDSDVESVASEKLKKRKKKNRDGSVSEESDKKKKRSKLKKHKKSGKKSKKKDRSASREKSQQSEEESNVNEYLEKKLREKALVSLMRKNKKI